MIPIAVINEIKTLPFPEIIKRLSEINVERYYTDLVRSEKIFYAKSGDSHCDPMISFAKPAIQFNEANVIAALRAIQNGDINYNTFIEKIIEAGVISYTVYIDGQKVTYLGRKGECYTQHFDF